MDGINAYGINAITLRFLGLVVTQQALTDTRYCHIHWLIQSAKKKHDTDRVMNFESPCYVRKQAQGEEVTYYGHEASQR